MPSGFRHTLESAIELARSRHGDEYDYSRLSFETTRDKVTLLHRSCGRWFEIQLCSHLTRSGCSYCFIKRRKTTEQFIKECLEFDKENHYDFSNVVEYKGNKSKVPIRCNKCKFLFCVAPLNFLNGSGCPECYGTPKKTTKEFISEAVAIHGDLFDYSATNYITNKVAVNIKCNKCDHIFEQKPTYHLKPKRVCPKCFSGTRSRIQSSKMEVDWLDQLKIEDRQQRLSNGKIADGLIGNTVYEFYGSYYHGDPRISTNKGVSKEILKKRFDRTMKRELSIKQAGYNIRFVWEHDWNNGKLFSEEHPKWD